MKNNLKNTNLNSPITLLLQWLTYAFWFWAIVSLAFLSLVVFNYFIGNNDAFETPNAIAYSLAASIILVLVSFVIDYIYSRREPLKKVGAASIIMIIHGVIFALYTILAVISMVFLSISLFINSNPSTDSIKAGISTSVLMAIMCACLLVRTVLTHKFVNTCKMYFIVMAIILLSLSIAGVAGPLKDSVVSKNDRLISENLPRLHSNISNFVSDNKRLPNDLSEINPKKNSDYSAPNPIVNKNLVIYRPEGESHLSEFKYQLCVNYKTAKESKGYDYKDKTKDQEGYSEYLNEIYSHPPGDVCYKLKSRYYIDNASNIDGSQDTDILSRPINGDRANNR